MLRQNVSLLEIKLNMGIIDKEVEKTDIKFTIGSLKNIQKIDIKSKMYEVFILILK